MQIILFLKRKVFSVIDIRLLDFLFLTVTGSEIAEVSIKVRNKLFDEKNDTTIFIKIIEKETTTKSYAVKITCL